MIYRDIINYTSIIMKNKSKNIFKKSQRIFEKFDNTLLESNNINENSKKPNYNEHKNASGILNSNELSFLIFSSNKDTNKFKKDALFGKLLSNSKEKDSIKFNSIVKNSNLFKYSHIYKNLENKINLNQRTDINYLTSEKNQLKNNGTQINLLSINKNKNYLTTIKRDYDNLFDNQNDYSLNDYLNLYQNDENIENNFSNDNSNKNNNQSPKKETSITNNNSSNVNDVTKNYMTNEFSTKNKNLEIITEERKKKNKKIMLNEELFNTHIKEKISKIKNDMIINNNIKQKSKEKKTNIKNNKYINSKLKEDEYTDYYEYMVEKLKQKDESKEMEKIFSEFLSEIKFKYWIQNSYIDFINSLNNCQIYELIKIKKENNNNKNCFDELISNMELSNNKNLSSNNSYLYNSKSELLRDGSHSINDSHSTQIIENQIEKNIPLISKFPKLMIPQSIIPEESSNFLYSNNEILKGSLGEIGDENFRTNLMEVQELEEEKNILYDENIKKEIMKIQYNKEIKLGYIFEILNKNNVFKEEKLIVEKDLIKEYKSKIFYDILLIAQRNDINITQNKPFGTIIKRM